MSAAVNQYDILYGLGAIVSAPVWLLKPKARRKMFHALSRDAGTIAARNPAIPAVMIHAVSLGEINATVRLVERLRELRPGVQFVISTTTETGFARGQQLYASQLDVTLVRYPLDFTHAVARLLDTQRPSAVALMELEVWPNFLRQCQKRKIPVVVINGRITDRSFGRYRLIKPLAAQMFGRLTRLCAQDQIYARRFIELGTPSDRVTVTGTMKFDSAQTEFDATATAKLAGAVGLLPGQEPIWVCGSTGPGEEQIILGQYRRLLKSLPNLRLVLVPRHPERFDEVANLIAEAGFACRRRSQSRNETSGSPIILGDSMGELRLWYALADVVFVGRTLLDLGPRQHGSDMIEPAALAKPTIVGPFTGNFDQPMNCLVTADAIRTVQTGDQLAEQVQKLLADPAAASALGERARQVVLDQRGATERHAQIIAELF
jgi:3-deoxy-D-manno-octulosonic-acid transferase